MSPIDKSDIQYIYHFYVSGYDILRETLFNYENLSGGRFLKYVCKSNFTYDSDIFNTCLSNFLSDFDPSGYFFISEDHPIGENILIENEFNPQFLNDRVESHSIKFKFVPTFMCDKSKEWCIYLHNDLDIFIVWADNSAIELFKKYFNIKNEDFYPETNDELFLNILTARYWPKPDFEDDSTVKSRIIEKNKYLF